MNEYKNYAIAAVSYILENLSEKTADMIENIVLFGSVAQDIATAGSDIDIFFDTGISEAQKKKLEKILNKIIESFYTSNRALKYKIDGIDSRINPIVGRLDDWKDLKRSIMSTGIVLFGRYRSAMRKGGLKQYFIISWDQPRKNRGAFLNKLYGYKTKRKHYQGMVDRYKCIKAGKSSLIVPTEHREKFTSHMDKYETGYRIIEVFL